MKIMWYIFVLQYMYFHFFFNGEGFYETYQGKECCNGWILSEGKNGHQSRGQEGIIMVESRWRVHTVYEDLFKFDILNLLLLMNESLYSWQVKLYLLLFCMFKIFFCLFIRIHNMRRCCLIGWLIFSCQDSRCFSYE